MIAHFKFKILAHGPDINFPEGPTCIVNQPHPDSDTGLLPIPKPMY